MFLGSLSKLNGVPSDEDTSTEFQGNAKPDTNDLNVEVFVTKKIKKTMAHRKNIAGRGRK